MDDYVVTKGGAICWHLDKIPFDDDVAKKAELELNERPEVKDKAIEELRLLITEEAEFITRTDDEFLLRFLRARKFDCKRAYSLLRNYCLFIDKCPSTFGVLRPSTVKDYISRNVYTILPYRDPEGRVIAIFRLGEILPERTPVNMGFLICAMSMEALIQNPASQIHGLVTIADFREMTLRFFTHVITPTNVRTFYSLLQGCFPGRLKSIHMVFGSTFIRMAYAASKLFLSEKLRRRFVFHGDGIGSLHEYIPPEILPEEYGGTLDLDRKQWPERVMSMEQYFIDLSTNTGKHTELHFPSSK